MMTRFDDRARLVFHFAREEGRRLGHTMIGPEHLLLGVLREGGEMVTLLDSFGMTLDEARSHLLAMVGQGGGLPEDTTAAITPRARRVMELAGFEAMKLGSDVIGVRHILLGIIEEGDGSARRTIEQFTPIDTLKARLLENAEVLPAIVSTQQPTVIAGDIGIVAVTRPSRVYLAIKYHEDFGNFILIDTITKMLERAGYQTSCIVGDVEVRDVERWGTVKLLPHELMHRAFREIDSSDVVLIELSEKGVGLGIEAGYAFAKGKPIITIAKRDSDISETLRGISRYVYFYDTFEELAKPLTETLAKIQE
jgi:hypothetical protein